VVDAAGSQMPVFVDGGFRRGTDVYKALAMGARAVGIGRAYIYGLSAFGQEAVGRVLDILCAELIRTMRQCGHADDSADHPGFNSQKWGASLVRDSSASAVSKS
jgi:isopentenyl diphosphate isomerase/L-lactate dehydrogenase-like FMN-dependent dehydrogenase